MTALTIGMDPAYKQTGVNARELWENTESGKRELADKAREEQERKEREEQERKERIDREMKQRVAQLQRLAEYDQSLDNNY
jgi:hypothetical protein